VCWFSLHPVVTMVIAYVSFSVLEIALRISTVPV
jgi:hypothetical protein